MANYKTKRTRKKRKFTQAEKLAYQLGQIDRGLKNPNSRVSESFNNGRKATKRTKKPLF